MANKKNDPKQKDGTSEKKHEIDTDINVLNCIGDSVASAHDCTGLIPRKDEIEAAEEFYEQMYDYLPHGVKPADKYSESE